MSNNRNPPNSTWTASTSLQHQHSDVPRTPSSQRSYNRPNVSSIVSNLSSQQSPAFSSNSTVRSNSTAVPTRSPTTPAGTPSRLAAIEAALKDMAARKTISPSPSPTSNQKQKGTVIFIEDSDEDEYVLTDAESLAEETLPQDGPIPLSTDSSQSSMDSMFSHLSGRSSSQSSDESPSRAAFPQQLATPVTKQITDKKVAPDTRHDIVPTCISDLFSSTSPNKQVLTTSPVRSSPSTRGIQSNVLKDVTDIPAIRTTQQEQPSAFLTVSNFAQSTFGSDLEHAVIAHDDEVQQLFDANKIEWGIQYEIARGITTSSWSWDEVRPHIREFIGNNETMAGKVRSKLNEIKGIKNQPSTRTHNKLWRELDREQAAIAENKGRGLGLMGEWKGNANWYGGRIQQIARLVKKDSQFKIVLEPMESQGSHRFARFYGSRRFLQVAVPQELLQNENEYEEVKKFLTKKFVLCGRVFVPFFSKDHHCSMVETNENKGRLEHHWCNDNLRMSFRDFINWHNPLTKQENYNQVISKYVTRFALGLSKSIPVLEFQENNIIFIDDLTSSKWPAGKKNPPAVMLMTDGCGFLNHAALLTMANYLEYESLPAGVQGRLDGSKGFWILHPIDQSEQPKIYIRESQNKIKNSSFDRAHRIFDLLGPSRTSGSHSLTSQSIMNVFANDIPAETLVRMMEDGLEKEIAPLLEWDRPNAMVFLWDAINKLGNVSGSRAQRVSTAMNRAMGLKGRDWRDADVSPDIDEGADDAPTYTGRNEYSGAPAGLHESAIELIQAGFHPRTCEVLNSKVASIIQVAINASVSKYRIPIEESLQAYIVPDPLDILKENQIYYRFSRPRRDPQTALLLYALEGDVLLGRYPIRLPSDMQKVQAVNLRELERWPDVVIVSTQGERSIASLLADGDMDGDELFVTWNKAIVNGFSNKEFTKAPEGLLQTDFSREVERVEEFCRRANRLSERDAHEAFQKIIVANLTDSKVGLYSSMHEKAVVKFGYHDDRTVRLAYIFATLLDSSKSGHRLNPDVFKKDRDLYLNIPTNTAADNDILCRLKVAAEEKGKDLIQRYQNLKVDSKSNDKDLLHPYKIYVDFCLRATDHGLKIFNNELELIRKHVDAAYDIWAEDIGKQKRDRELNTPSSRTKKNKKKDDTSKAASLYAQSIEGIVLTPNVEELKASYACALGKNHTFAFNVCFEEVCRIKACTSPGGHAPNLRIFDEAKTFSSSFLRALNSHNDD